MGAFKKNFTIMGQCKICYLFKSQKDDHGHPAGKYKSYTQYEL